jgi:chromosomal replication initiation ATPase DnaA
MIVVTDIWQTSPYALAGLSEKCEKVTLLSRDKNPIHIRQLVCHWFNIPVEVICSDKKRKNGAGKRHGSTEEVVIVRQVCMMLMRRHTPLSLCAIAKMFGEASFDHTTVLHSIKAVKNRMEIYPLFRDKVRSIELEIIEETT